MERVQHMPGDDALAGRPPDSCRTVSPVACLNGWHVDAEVLPVLDMTPMHRLG